MSSKPNIKVLLNFQSATKRIEGDVIIGEEIRTLNVLFSIEDLMVSRSRDLYYGEPTKATLRKLKNSEPEEEGNIIYSQK